jgi:O-antigen/teichoic acid export membrane protein
MISGHWKFIKNAAANVISGGASGIIALLLPYYFVRIFNQLEFSLWVLVLQLAAYVNFLNFGVQVAVGRFVTHALARGRQKEAEEVLAAGLQILAALALLALAIIISIVFFLPLIFKTISPSMIGTARVMLLWVGSALAVGLPFSAFLGVFVGMQRNDVPAGIALVSKGLLAIVLVIVAERTHSLVKVASAYFLVSMAGYILHYATFKWICSGWHIRLLGVESALRRELISYCLSSSAWTLAMLLTRGLDTTIVGIYDFRNVAGYGVSANVVALFVGFFTAITAPLLQIFTKYHAKADEQSMAISLKSSSYLISILLLISACWAILPASPVFERWVGPQVARIGVPIFSILIFANAIRNSAAPYSTYLWAASMQKRVYLSPFVEGVTNLIASIVLAKYIGAIGVAWGTAIGAVAGILANFVYNFSRTLPKKLPIREFAMENIVVPCLVGLPMLIVLAVMWRFKIALHFAAPCMIIATLPSAIAGWRKYKELERLKGQPSSMMPQV